MNGGTDPRHQNRIQIVQRLFALSFSTDELKPSSLPENASASVVQMTTAVIQTKETIDKLIATNAPRYPLDKIAKIDLAILRLALYELTIDKKEPPKVIINEAVEMAKELGNERSYAFINAVLGAAIESKHE